MGLWGTVAKVEITSRITKAQPTRSKDPLAVVAVPDQGGGATGLRADGPPTGSVGRPRNPRPQEKRKALRRAAEEGVDALYERGEAVEIARGPGTHPGG